MEILRTKRLLLRPMKPDDLPDLFVVFSNAQAMRYWSTLPHQKPEETRDLIEATRHANPSTTADFAIEMDGRVIGKAGFWNFPEIGYILHPDYWRQGLATEALEAVISYGFNVVNLDQITADVDPDNLASVRLLTGLGFKETGRAKRTFQIGGTWFDSIYFALQRPQ